MILNNKGESGVLLVVGVALLIAGIVVGLVTGIWEVNNARENAQNTDVVSVFGWTIVGFALAIGLIVVGVLFIIFGARG